MAGSLVGNTPAITPIEKGRHGYIALSISNYDNNNEPQGQGNVEVAGGLYEFDSLESITGWSGISNSTDNVYIKTVPAGTSITLAFITTAPAWSDAKQGWYSPTGGEEDHRYTNFKLDKDGSGNYVNKREWGYFKRGGKIDISAPDYGAIGCITIAYSTSWTTNTEYLPDTTVAGSTLERSTHSISSGNPLNIHDHDSVQVQAGAKTSLGFTGTWRLLTRIYRGDSTIVFPVGLFQRIS